MSAGWWGSGSPSGGSRSRSGPRKAPAPPLRRNRTSLPRPAGRGTREAGRTAAGGGARTAGTELESTIEAVERADELVSMLAKGLTLDPKVLEQQVGRLLDLVDRADREGRLDDELRLARALVALLALVPRWLALVEVLTPRRDRGRGRRCGRRGWAEHELGTLALATDDAEAATSHLERRWSGRRRETRPARGDAPQPRARAHRGGGRGANAHPDPAATPALASAWSQPSSCSGRRRGGAGPTIPPTARPRTRRRPGASRQTTAGRRNPPIRRARPWSSRAGRGGARLDRGRRSRGRPERRGERGLHRDRPGRLGRAGGGHGGAVRRDVGHDHRPRRRLRIVAAANRRRQATRASRSAPLLVDNTAPTVTQETPEPGEGSYRLERRGGGRRLGRRVGALRARATGGTPDWQELETVESPSAAGATRPRSTWKGARVLRVPRRRGRRGRQRGRLEHQRVVIIRLGGDGANFVHASPAAAERACGPSPG